MTPWESIARQHGPMAFETAWRILGHVQDTEDAVQEALLDALRLYRAGQVRSWGGLLRHLAACRALDRLRRRRPANPVTADLPAPAGERPEHVAAGRELTDRLRAALAALPEQQAAVFSLRWFGGLSNSEIAETLQISAHAVAVSLHKARATLARLLDAAEAGAGRSGEQAVTRKDHL